MRIQNTFKNIVFGLSGQIISIILGFIVRTVFIKTLGAEYLGINGLFSNILLIFSLANLGFDTAIIYSLYTPLAENDKYKIQALMNLYQKAYKVIGVVVLLIGLTLLPFISNFTNNNNSINHINLIYLIFLLNSVASYYFVYKHSIIIADQKNHIISKVHTLFIFLSNIIQIIFLVFMRNYIAVLGIQIIFGITENIYISKRANQLYPFIKGKNNARLSKDEKKTFYENLYSLLLYKISGVVINGTDNIIMSVYVGIHSVGIYSNYLLVFSTLTTVLSYIFYSVTASVGNLVVKEDSEKKYLIFKVLNLTSLWIYSYCAVVLWILINPFISLWLGREFVFNQFVVLAIILNFVTTGFQNTCTTFRETTGLFKKGKYRPIVAAIINLVASILLTKEIGIAGLFWGTIISRVLTYFWYDPFVIYKYIFEKPVISYFVQYATFTLIIFFSVLITDILSNLVKTEYIGNIILHLIFSSVILNLIIFLLYRKSAEMDYLFCIVKSLKNKFQSSLSKRAYD